MKRSACRKSPQNSTRVTQRGTCLRQVAGPHSRKKKEELARLFCRIFFWHRALRAHRRQHQTSTHLDQQELIHRSRSKMTIYTLSNKQKTSQQHYNIGKKERKEIVIRTEQQYCAILESVITKQNGLLLYFKNKRLFWRSILQHNATAQCTYITFEPHLSVKTSHTFSPVCFYTKESSNHASRTPQLVPLKCVYI